MSVEGVAPAPQGGIARFADMAHVRRVAERYNTDVGSSGLFAAAPFVVWGGTFRVVENALLV